MTARGGGLLERLWRRWSPGYVASEAERGAVRAVLGRPDAARAALGYYRALLAPWRGESRRAVGLLRRPLAVPKLALSGADDGCMGASLFAPAVARAPRADGVEVRRREVAGAGHFLRLERPEVVRAEILAWLAERER